MNDLQVSKQRLWTGYVLSGLTILFLLTDSIMKLIKPPVVVKGTVDLGYAESMIVGIGVAQLIATVLYIVPRTSVLGAVLLTGYLGGAVASGVRAAKPIFNVVFPFVFACVVWAGLWLREKRLQALLPLRSQTRPAD